MNQMNKHDNYVPNVYERLVHRVANVLTYLDLIHKPDLLLIAVSGGPDSMTLLSILADLRMSLDLNLHVAHLNHKLRCDESDLDAVFVKNSAAALGIPATIGTEDVMAYKQRYQLSLEEAARASRYSFLTTVATELGSNTIILGHTMDDQVETILMHIIRGSGVNGLIGMTPKSSININGTEHPVDLVRPMLGVNRKEVNAYCISKNIKPRYDSSNLDMAITRNRLRAQLIPAINSYNPKFGESLLRLSRSSARDRAYIESATDAAIRQLITKSYLGVSITKLGFANLHSAIQRNLLRKMYQNLTGSILGLEYQHVELMVDISRTETNKSINLPKGITFFVDSAYIIMTKSGSPIDNPTVLIGEYSLQIPGYIQIPGWTITTRISGKENPPHNHDNNHDIYFARVDRLQVGNNLIVRSRKPGDKFQPLGMSGTKKLQDFMIDEKIPRNLRNQIPIVVSGGSIVWVVGYRIADWAKQDVLTDESIELEFTRPTSLPITEN